MESDHGYADGDLYDGTVEDGSKAQDFGCGGHTGIEGYHIITCDKGHHCGEFCGEDPFGSDPVREQI